jgi:hypothetical protein
MPGAFGFAFAKTGSSSFSGGLHALIQAWSPPESVCLWHSHDLEFTSNEICNRGRG